MIKNKTLVKNIVMQYLMVMAQYIFPLITFPYLTRILENEAYGIHTYMISVITYLQLIVDFGFSLSSTKQISQNREDKQRIQQIFSETIGAKILIFVVSIALFSAFVPFQSILKSNLLLSYLYLGTVLFSIFTADFLFRGLEKMEILTYRFVASKIVSTFLTFVLVKDSGDLVWVPILNAAGSFVAVVITWRYIYKNIGIKFCFSKFLKVWYQIRASVVYFTSNVATTAFGTFTTIIMGFSLSPIEISFWGSSYNLISTVQSLYSPVINSVFPNMVKNKNPSLIKTLMWLFMPCVIVGCVICYFGADLIITIMCGEDYLPAIPIFIGLIPVLLCSFPAMLLGFPLLGVMGYTKQVTRSTIIAAIYHIVGIILLFSIGKLSLFSIALLRSSTEFILLLTRGFYCVRYRKQLFHVYITNKNSEDINNE